MTKALSFVPSKAVPKLVGHTFQATTNFNLAGRTMKAVLLETVEKQSGSKEMKFINVLL